MDHKMKLIDYLYGEMNAQEREHFEQQLATNKELRDQLSTLQSVRKFAASDRDVAPSGIVQIMPAKSVTSRPWQSKWLALAASLLVLLVAGKFLDLRVTTQKGQFAIQYGEVIAPVEDDVRTIVQEELAKEHQYVQTQLASFSQQIEKQLSSRPEIDDGRDALKTQLASYANQISALRTDLRNDQADRHNVLLERLHEDQRDHSTELMQGMVRYVENQRRQDLELINQGFKNLSMAVQLGESYTQFASQPLQKF